MQGYWRDEEAANAEVFHDGWYFTGDRAVKDEDGYLWFVSRSDDVIISASYRIGPFEVESALVEHPAVVESAVVGKPDPDRTSIVKAFVVLAPGHEATDALARELQEHVKSVTAPYKYPREIEFVDSLPKTISGKIADRLARALVTPLPPFEIERYFAVHEFAVPYLLWPGRRAAVTARAARLCRRRDAAALGRPRARLHRDARLAAPAPGDRRALRDARGR